MPAPDQRGARHRIALVAIDCTQQPAQLAGVGNRRMVAFLGAGQRAAQVGNRVALCPSGGNGVAHDLPAVLQDAVRRFDSVAFLDSSGDAQELRRGHLGHRLAAARSAPATFAALRCSPGSMPAASALRASARLSRASAKLVSG